MSKPLQIFLFVFCLSLAGLSHAVDPKAENHNTVSHSADNEIPQLPSWQVLAFEEKAFWATARSRLEILPVADDPGHWQLDVQSSVVNNSEQVNVLFDPTTGNAFTRSRLSEGKERRLKTYRYETDFILRERRNPAADSSVPPQEWPVSSSKKLPYPVSKGDTVVTGPYLLILLAQQLQQQLQEPGQESEKSMGVLVHTDLNFYRVHLTSGNGIPIDANYEETGKGQVSGRRDTVAVAVQATPEVTPEKKNDFSLLGLTGEIIIFFDRETGLPLQIRGQAPRIGATEINLKSVTMRESAQ